MTVTVDLYLRKSSKDERRSVTRQQRDLTESAAEEGYAVGRTFVDPDLSASPFATKDRPDYAALIEYIRSGGCEMLGLWEGSRGSRELEEWAAFLKLCAKHRVSIWIQANDRVYRPWRTADWRELANLGVDAEAESRQLSDRVLVGKRDAARNGTPAGRLQYGFTRVYDEKGKFVEQRAHPEQGPIVAEMVDRLHAGEQLATIARDLNRRGVTMPGGAPWHGRFIRQTVLRPAYAGIRVDRGEEVGPASWKPIVDVAKWRAVRALLTRPERRVTSRGPTLTHWLTGAVACGTCRTERLRARTGGTKRPRATYQCEKCGMVVAAGTLEAVIEEALLGRLQQDDALDALRSQGDGEELRTADEEVRVLRERLDAHYAEAAAGDLSARGLSAVEGRLLPQIEAAERRARVLAVPSELEGEEPADIVKGWPGYSPQRKRVVVRVLAELVVTRAARRGPVFDIARLADSRWVGDPMTWGEHWAAASIVDIQSIPTL